MRVLCTCLPGHGHFNPMLALAQGLTRAGHDVLREELGLLVEPEEAEFLFKS